MHVLPTLLLLFVLAAPVFAWPLGDTLTVIQRPILSIPTILAAGESLDVECAAPAGTGDWEIALHRKPRGFPLERPEVEYDGESGLWRLRVRVPEEMPEELYDLVVTASGVPDDTARHAVKVLHEYPDEWVFAQVTDTHLPGHTFSRDQGWDTDSTEEADFREVIRDLNLIRPQFLLLTGDFVNEGELEDYREHRVYSRAKRLLHELEVPVYLVAGNHDVGGWVDTPPPAGTARRDWWRFFGWRRLGDAASDVRTQDYFFDFGGIRFIGLESYDNYDRWLMQIYGEDSFRRQQLEFLRDAIDGAPEGARRVLFYHYDFSGQVTNPGAWGVDMILYGHIHRDDGSIHDPIPVLATRSCCDGNRSYRIVAVKEGNPSARTTVGAGRSGQNLAVRYDRPNDGRAHENAATLTNRFSMPLPHAEITFLAAPEGAPYDARGGEVARVFDADTAMVVVVRAPVRGSDSVTVEILSGTAGPSPSEPPETPGALVLRGNAPNPFNGITKIRFDLPRSGDVEVRLYDVKGRSLFPVARGPFPEGPSAVPWDGHAPSGVRVPSGVYFVKVLFEGEERTGRIVYLR